MVHAEEGQTRKQSTNSVCYIQSLSYRRVTGKKWRFVKSTRQLKRVDKKLDEDGHHLTKAHHFFLIKASSRPNEISNLMWANTFL